MSGAGDKSDDGWGGDWGPEDQSGAAAEIEREVKKPRLYSVLLHNDNYTTMEFVVLVLTTIFNRSEADAVQIMLHVHTKGAGVAGTYSLEVAETRAEKTIRLARDNEFPLRCTVEPD